MATDPNPYLAPEPVIEIPEPVVGPKRRPILWTVLYLANLIVPLFFGFQCVDGWIGAIGMFAAILVFYAMTLFIAERRRRLYAPACVGAAFVGLSQFYPVTQMYAGMVALTITGMLFGQTKPGNMGLLPSGFATIITGLLLLLVAMAFGEVCRFVGSVVNRRR